MHFLLNLEVNKFVQCNQYKYSFKYDIFWVTLFIAFRLFVLSVIPYILCQPEITQLKSLSFLCYVVCQWTFQVSYGSLFTKNVDYHLMLYRYCTFPISSLYYHTERSDCESFHTLMFVFNKSSSEITLSQSLIDKTEERLDIFGDRVDMSSSLSESSCSENNDPEKKKRKRYY